MSEERVVRSASALEEDTDGTGEEQSAGCFQAPGLCCCIPTRRMSLPGRRPKERKEKNGKKNTNVPSLDDIMFQERQQNRDRDNWSMTSVGDLGSLQMENIKPALTQLHDKNSQEPHIPVLLGDIFLEEKQGYDDRTNANVQTKDCEQKEVLEDLKISPLETENANSVDGLSEVKDYPIMSAKENRHSEKPDLNALFEEVPYKKHNEGGDHMSLILQPIPCKKEMNQGHQDMLPEELQQSKELEFDSTLTTHEKILQEEQSTSTDSEGITTLQEMLNQSSVLYSEEENLLGRQELAMGITYSREKQIRQLNSLSEGDAYKEDQICQGILKNEAQKPTELKYPDILSTMCESHEEEKAGVQQHLYTVTEASFNDLKQNCINLLDWKDPSPVIPQDINFPCQSTSCEKEQKDVQATIKVEDHQSMPYHFYQQTTVPESTILSLDATNTTNIQMLDNINSLPEDAVVHITEQKHPETQEQILLEQINTYHHSKGKEQHGGLEYTHSGSKDTEEEDNQQSLVSEDFSKPLGSISFEKEQRKLDCGDSGPEGIYDKEEQDCQDHLCTEVQQPLIISKLTSLPLNSSEEPCEKKNSTIVGNLDIHSLDGNPEEQDGRCISASASSKEKEATLEPEEKWLTMPLLSEVEKEEPPPESRHIVKGASVPHEVQQQKEELNIDISCETQQRKENNLSNTTFSGDAVQDEGLM
ncbi:uncharacterized protein LOC112540126 [Python bivittatus]|uniref:Uncharacterized protein LOC112540126 n=1 Tax=Python bivittatus TaxID=176946 RepID=A0A9F5MUF9_PYTBI|nr:uncharacterized protein LOC112540126 [Python bivittatus]